MSRTTGWRARVCAIGALTMLAATACTGEAPPPPTLRVDRGTVATTVSASGTLVGISEQTLGFPARGKLVEVLVGVGARVEPGAVLARVDDFALRQTLEQEQADLASAQAELDRATGGNTVNATGRTLDQAREILEAVRKQVNETNEFNRSATDRARKQLDFDRKALDRAEDQLRRDLAACDGDDSAAQAEATPQQEESQNSGSTGNSDSNNSNNSNNSDSNEDEDDDSGARVEGASFNNLPGDCAQVSASQSAVESAKRTVIQSETALDTAKHQEDVDAAAGRVTVEREEQTVISAENDRGAAENDRPADINVQEAAVRNAQAAVEVAQRDVDNTVLRAPVAGVVSAVNGRVGEFVGEANTTTPSAPGGAPLPQSSDLAAGGDNGGGGSTAPGGGAFMVMNNIDSFQLVVPFEESDAARIAPNQQVEVTVDAIPDLRAPATVMAVAPAGNPASGIVEYYATIVLREGADPRLRDGQTALADVVVESVDNVLRVPSAAVRRDATGTFVDVLNQEDGQPRPQPFTAGAVGDEYTQVLSGLREDQEILLPPPPAAQGQSGGGPGG
jgi:HlyD family secretion protein